MYDQHMARMSLNDMNLTGDDIQHVVSKRTTIETLAEELRRRGCVVYYPDEVDLIAKTQIEVDEASTDFDKWMRLAGAVDNIVATEGRYEGSLVDRTLARSILLLVDLLQPPAVREARSAQAE